MALTVSGRTLYTVLELSEKLNVTTVTIRNYLKQGKIKGQKAMGRWFISEEDVTDLFKKLQ
jgi:predicted site-specific integrase-resolvase